MKKEKECYEVPCADIVDIRMEGSLLQGSATAEIKPAGGEDEPVDEPLGYD